MKITKLLVLALLVQVPFVHADERGVKLGLFGRGITLGVYSPEKDVPRATNAVPVASAVPTSVVAAPAPVIASVPAPVASAPAQTYSYEQKQWPVTTSPTTSWQSQSAPVQTAVVSQCVVDQAPVQYSYAQPQKVSYANYHGPHTQKRLAQYRQQVLEQAQSQYSQPQAVAYNAQGFATQPVVTRYQVQPQRVSVNAGQYFVQR